MGIRVMCIREDILRHEQTIAIILELNHGVAEFEI